MLELQGKYNTAKVFTDEVESSAMAQIIELCCQSFVQDNTIRIMPDCHAGAGCTIGTTMTLNGKVCPNVCGVDIGCGVIVADVGTKDIDLEKLDEAIRKYVPSGFNVHSNPFRNDRIERRLDELYCKDFVNLDRAMASIGTLGGGNHFIEVDVDTAGRKYLVVHTGSRNLGKQAAEHYQRLAIKQCNDSSQAVSEIVASYKANGRERELQSVLKQYQHYKVPQHLAFLSGDLFDQYIHDMKIIQRYAMSNRYAILLAILEHTDLCMERQICDTVHNYIDTDAMILRKGAVSAKSGEALIIPMNMRDGSLICIGKGNPDWNFSAPHGAGRIMSRSQAKKELSLAQYQDEMKDVFSTTVTLGTLDEAPMAYKSMESIMGNVVDTVMITNIIKPIYNYKNEGD